jgi:hypothetical protein
MVPCRTFSLNISTAHPAQHMPPWSEAYGGPRRDDQVEDLIQFVLNRPGRQPAGVRQEGVSVLPTQPPEEAGPEVPSGPTGEGDPANGGEISAQYSVSCHGPDAGGGALGSTLVSAQGAAKDQAAFQETLAKGRPGTSMPPWDGPLSPQQIEDWIVFLRSKL